MNRYEIQLKTKFCIVKTVNAGAAASSSRQTSCCYARMESEAYFLQSFCLISIGNVSSRMLNLADGGGDCGSGGQTGGSRRRNGGGTRTERQTRTQASQPAISLATLKFRIRNNQRGEWVLFQDRVPNSCICETYAALQMMTRIILTV